MKDLDISAKTSIIFNKWGDEIHLLNAGGRGKMSQERDPFDVLEGKINQLMAAYDALKAENEALGRQLNESRAAAKSLEEKVNRLGQERERAREKVENLLGRLDRLIVSNP